MPGNSVSPEGARQARPERGSTRANLRPTDESSPGEEPPWSDSSGDSTVAVGARGMLRFGLSTPKAYNSTAQGKRGAQRAHRATLGHRCPPSRLPQRGCTCPSRSGERSSQAVEPRWGSGRWGDAYPGLLRNPGLWRCTPSAYKGLLGAARLGAEPTARGSATVVA